MMKRLLLAAVAVSSPLLSLAAQAQDIPKLDTNVIQARYLALKPHTVPGVTFPKADARTGNLVQWNGTFKDQTNKTVTYTMVGQDPSTSNTTSTVRTIIIPVKMVYGSSNGNMTFDPTVDTDVNGATVIDNLTASPLFTSSVDFVEGGTDLGTTQYIDAFQRANFWSSVSTNTGYHVMLKPVVYPRTLTINVSSSQGHVMSNPFAPGSVGTMGINAFDAKLQGFISKIKAINPSVLPLFVTDNIFLTSGGCCIGGYHSANAAQPTGQTYSYSTYVTSAGSFSQDVSALSHEIGEWMDDPFVDNSVNCNDNSILEVGDPLEGNANYGGYPYTVNGFTYNLQSMVFLPYFGAPTSTSLKGWYSFQNDEGGTCPGQ